MDAVALRNFKDFLEIYNKITENCFNQCTSTMTHRERLGSEISCVENCAQKHINVNHKIMKLYMEIQPEFVKRKMEETNRIQHETLLMNASEQSDS